MRIGIDYLAIENFLLGKAAQPETPADESWRREFELD
jgi:hypothetical protein